MQNKFSIFPIRLGCLPIIERYIEKLQLNKLFSDLVPSDPRDKFAVNKTLMIILRNIILERHPLYQIGQWANRRNLITNTQISCMTDDRIGRSLTRLFNADRTQMITKTILRAVDVFKISTNRIHNDSTSVTLNGTYQNYSDTQAAKPKWGVNKDFRPDLRQLVYSLSVSSDEAIPLFFKVWDGNKTDDTTHIENWKSLSSLVGNTNFVYVADSKLCVKETMLFIDSKGGYFITVIPQTRSEIRRFKQQIQTTPPQWKLATDEENPRGKNLPRRIFWTYDSPSCSSEGFRIIWVKSSLKQIQDEQRRSNKIKKCENQFKELTKKKHKNKQKLTKTVERILQSLNVGMYFNCQIKMFKEEEFKQTRKGRPNSQTEYRKIEKEFYQLTWSQNQQQICYDARYDGIFPLITNDKNSSSTQILASYKYQPRLEKRFEQLKTIYKVAPVYLKNPERIEALLTLYFFAMLITSLIERTVRLSMKNNKLESIPIYPEKRQCKAPTADKILNLFDDVRIQHIVKDKKIIQTVADELSEIQIEVLKLLNIDKNSFFNDL